MNEKDVKNIKFNVNKILQYFSNTDFNIKVLIDKVNKLVNSNNDLLKKFDELSAKVDVLSSNDPKEPVGLLKRVVPPQNNMGFKVTADVSAPKIPDHKENIPEKSIFNSKKEENQSLQYKNIFQKILFKDGRPIYLADVKVVDDSGNVLKQTRTNPKGKWIAQLAPGDYTVHVKKKIEEGLKLPIDLRFRINIPDIEQSDFELDPPEIADVY